MRGNHRIYVDSVIEPPDIEEFHRERGDIVLHQRPGYTDNLQNKLWYSKSLLLTAKYPGVYLTKWNFNPIKCNLHKLIKNKNLRESLVEVDEKNLCYQYKPTKMEFELVDKEEVALNQSQSVKALPKNNFKRITNILSSHKNELKQLQGQNETLRKQLVDLDNRCEAKK